MAPESRAADSLAAQYVLGLADDALVYAQRLGEWISRAPQIEEDMALANVGLDLLGQARALLGRVGELDGTSRSEDDLAYFRDEREFRNVHLVEQECSGFGFEMARLLWFATYQRELYAALRASTVEVLAGVAGKALKEVDYHRDHATQWALRLGDGTEESHRRMQDGLATVWPYVAELFQTDELEQRLVRDGVAVDVSTLRPEWDSYVGSVLQEATLEVPDGVPTLPGGGRRGVHTEAFGYLLAEMQHLHRSHPGASW